MHLGRTQRPALIVSMDNLGFDTPSLKESIEERFYCLYQLALRVPLLVTQEP